jgi:tripartite-type tricarboxylate transporter receptor subunit TctC
MPELPTLQESGLPNYVFDSWYGLLAPAKTPPAIVEQLHRETVRALQSPDLRDSLKNQGAEPVGNSGEQFNTIIKDEIGKWRKLVETLGLKAD